MVASKKQSAWTTVARAQVEGVRDRAANEKIKTIAANAWGGVVSSGAQTLTKSFSKAGQLIGGGYKLSAAVGGVATVGAHALRFMVRTRYEAKRKQGVIEKKGRNKRRHRKAKRIKKAIETRPEASGGDASLMDKEPKNVDVAIKYMEQRDFKEGNRDRTWGEVAKDLGNEVLPALASGVAVTAVGSIPGFEAVSTNPWIQFGVGAVINSGVTFVGNAVGEGANVAVVMPVDVFQLDQAQRATTCGAGGIT